MQTTAATVSAVSVAVLPVCPKNKNTRHVSSSVATVMPEIGFDEEPISPVSREETVTNRKPNITMHTAPNEPVEAESQAQGRRSRQGDDQAQAAENRRTSQGRSRSRARHARALLLAGRRMRRSPKAPCNERMINGSAWNMLMMPPVATAPAPI